MKQEAKDAARQSKADAKAAAKKVKANQVVPEPHAKPHAGASILALSTGLPGTPSPAKPSPKGAKWAPFVADLQKLAAQAHGRAQAPAALAASMQALCRRAPAWVAALPATEAAGARHDAAAAAAGVADAVLRPIVAHAERTLAHGSASSSGMHGGGGGTWDTLEVPDLLGALRDAAATEYGGATLAAAAAPVRACSELLLLLHCASAGQPPPPGYAACTGEVPSMSSIASMLCIVLFRRVTLESGEALAAKVCVCVGGGCVCVLMKLREEVVWALAGVEVTVGWRGWRGGGVGACGKGTWLWGKAGGVAIVDTRLEPRDVRAACCAADVAGGV